MHNTVLYFTSYVISLNIGSSIIVGCFFYQACVLPTRYLSAGQYVVWYIYSTTMMTLKNLQTDYAPLRSILSHRERTGVS